MKIENWLKTSSNLSEYIRADNVKSNEIKGNKKFTSNYTCTNYKHPQGENERWKFWRLENFVILPYVANSSTKRLHWENFLGITKTE